MTPAIEVAGVGFAHPRASGGTALRLRASGATEVLRNLSLEVGAGEILALLGPSGCGKTTLVRLILGLLAPATGTIRIDGRTVSAPGRILTPPEKRGLAVVFQDLALWPHLTVAGNLAFGLSAQGVRRRERRRRIAAMLERVGLESHRRRYPGELSGGERQRVAIARALVLEPRAVLFDEPLTHLDVALRRELLEVFRQLLAERGPAEGAAALYVTHDPREAASLGDRIAVLEGGEITCAGSWTELAGAPAAGAPASAFSSALLKEMAPSGAEPA
ncbi:MAG: ABC transporter ATP-binding protein [bacterium]|nr:ABC transporter ATP-binding protein [bacterium]